MEYSHDFDALQGAIADNYRQYWATFGTGAGGGLAITKTVAISNPASTLFLFNQVLKFDAAAIERDGGVVDAAIDNVIAKMHGPSTFLWPIYTDAASKALKQRLEVWEGHCGLLSWRYTSVCVPL
jgi:hypothetical protein